MDDCSYTPRLISPPPQLLRSRAVTQTNIWNPQRSAAALISCGGSMWGPAAPPCCCSLSVAFLPSVATLAASSAALPLGFPCCCSFYIYSWQHCAGLLASPGSCWLITDFTWSIDVAALSSFVEELSNQPA